MCTGAEIAALVATAVGTGVSMDAQRKTKKAGERAAEADLMRKDKMSKQAEAIFNAEVGNSDAGDAQAKVDQAAAEQLAAAQFLVGRDQGFTSATETSALAGASPVVKETAARTLADELQRSGSQMKARSVLQGYGQRARQRADQFGRAADQMAMLGNFGRGWDQVSQVEREMAKYAGSNQAMLGDFLTGIGSMGMAASNAGLFGGGAGAAGGSGLTMPVEGAATGSGLGTGKAFSNSGNGLSYRSTSSLWR